MDVFERVEPYTARVSKDTLAKLGGVVRVWSEPVSAIEGANIVAEITEPIEVTVIEEQKDVYGSIAQRARIHYSNIPDGWVLYDALVPK